MSSILAFFKSLFNKIVAFFTRKKNSDKPENDGPVSDPGEIVCYYGCPNSNKAKKLQLNKNTYR